MHSRHQSIYRSISILLALLLMTSFPGCQRTDEANEDDGTLKIVTTLYAAYDFARQVGGDKVEVTLLLKPGSESHSYEPSPKDIIAIQNCDLFICTGGENDAWVDALLTSVSGSDMNIIRMVDCVTALEEEVTVGMQVREDESSSDEPEWDEHVWMSPVNAGLITSQISTSLTALDPDNSDYYYKRSLDYLDRLALLDSDIRTAVSLGNRKEIIFADRFPARYFTEEYGIRYYAAFPGCSENTEASAATVSFLIDKVREDHIPAVFTIELSGGRLAAAIAEETNTTVLTFYTGHNVTSDDFTAGVTYIDLMYRNIEALKLALN